MKIYELARYYDIAFGFRDVPAECDFLEALARRYHGRELRSFLELAAGPARHALEFAKRGVRAAALDSAQHMLDYAMDNARQQQLDIDCICADMVSFRLPQIYDVAALLMDSAAYLLDNDAVLKHLACVAEHLAESGLYVLEMTHPRDVFKLGNSTMAKWEMDRDGTKVSIEWGSENDVFDPIAQTVDTTVTLGCEGQGESDVFTDCATQRYFTANEFQALVVASGRFEIVEIFGAMSVSIPFTNENQAWRMGPVLQKTR
jgi:SAM-dependent methyltransferase